MTPSEQLLYQSTVAVKNGTTHLPQSFRTLKDWIDVHLGVAAVNIIYQDPRTSPSIKYPSLTIVVETEQDWKKIKGWSHGLSKDFKSFVFNTFRGVVSSLQLQRQYQLRGIKINGHCFAHWAHEIAIEKALKYDKVHLLQRMSPFNICDVLRSSMKTIFIFYTKENQNDAEIHRDAAKIRKIYARYLKEYDPFGYCTPKSLLLDFDNAEDQVLRSPIRPFQYN